MCIAQSILHLCALGRVLPLWRDPEGANHVPATSQAPRRQEGARATESGACRCVVDGGWLVALLHGRYVEYVVD